MPVRSKASPRLNPHSTVGVAPGPCEELGVLPAVARHQIGAVGDVLVVEGTASHVARLLRHRVRPRQVVEQEAQPLDGALLAELPGGLELVRAIDADLGEVDRRVLLDQPLRHDVTEATAHQDSDRVEPAREIEAVDLRRLAEHR